MCSPWKGKTDVESMGTLAPEIKRKGMPADYASGQRKEEEKVMEGTYRLHVVSHTTNSAHSVIGINIINCPVHFFPQ